MGIIVIRIPKDLPRRRISIAIDELDWMSELPKKLHDVPLNQLAIPGSHDSTTYFLDKSAAPSPDCDPVLIEISKALPQAKTIIYNWSQTQALTFTQQLEAGIRYLDLRVSMKTGTEDLYLVHGLYSHKVQDMAHDVKKFLQQHPKEVVLMDFNHFYDVSDDQHCACLKMLMNMFEDKMFPYSDTDSLTLNTFWEKGLQVVAFYHHPMAKGNLHFWPGECIPSPWPNTTNTETLIEFLEKNYKLERDMSKFYVTQGVLTPDAGMVTAHLFSTLKAQCAEKCGDPFVKWLQGKKCGDQGINVCIIDYVGLFAYIPVVLQLNQTWVEN